jgi:zinc transport system substrate-binding protein
MTIYRQALQDRSRRAIAVVVCVSIGLSLALLTGCAAPPRDDRLRVLVSVPPVAFLVDRIGADRVAVEVMIPPGASPVTHEPSPHQMLAVQRASLYFALGHPAFPFERRNLGIFRQQNPSLEVVALIPPSDSASGSEDPHVWLAPPFAADAARSIADALSEMMPAAEPLFRTNLTSLLREITELDDEIRALLAPVRERKFVVYHPAWGHFANHYGLLQLALQREGKDPGPGTLAALLGEVQEDRATVVFVQREFSQRSAQTLASELGARVVTLDPLAYDWSANLRRTAAEIRKALDGV